MIKTILLAVGGAVPTDPATAEEKHSVLVLTRKTGEGIVVGDDVQVKVLRISGSRVTIGIEAPRSVRVQRATVEGEVVSGRVVDSAPPDRTVR